MLTGLANDALVVRSRTMLGGAAVKWDTEEPLNNDVLVQPAFGAVKLIVIGGPGSQRDRRDDRNHQPHANLFISRHKINLSGVDLNQLRSCSMMLPTARESVQLGY